jgi:hypothetical protein
MENLIPWLGPHEAAQPRAAHARTRDPTVRGGPRRATQAGENAGALAKTRKSPQANCYWHDQEFHYSRRQMLCKNTLALSYLHIGEVPDAPPHAGAALAGTGRLRRPAESLYRAPKGETLTSVQMRSTGQQYGGPETG